MDKKTIKAILDVIKDVSDRPGLYGAQFIGDQKGDCLFFTDGYVCVRLDIDEFSREVRDSAWVSGEQLKETYKKMGARDFITSFKNDGGKAHPNWRKCWEEWTGGATNNCSVPIRPETFKKLAPFGDMVMTIKDCEGLNRPLVVFNGDKVNAVGCPLARI